MTPEALDTWLEHLATLPAGRVASSEALACLSALSERLLGASSQAPAAQALGFWLRRRHLEALADRLRGLAPGERAVPRGLVFHVTPSNTETQFAYAWALSVLAGNANLVRLSSRRAADSESLRAHIDAVLDVPRFAELRARNCLASWPRQADALTRRASLAADVRVLWGGDETVGALRALPARPGVQDLAFVDRRSLAALSARAVCALDDVGLARLANRFWQDAWVFDQRACASPQHVVWLGPDDVVHQASARFWAAIDAELARRGHRDDPALAMHRRVGLTTLAATAEAPFQVLRRAVDGATVVRTGLAALGELASPGGGLFFELRVEALSELAPWLDGRHQTLATFGVEPSALDALLEAVAGRALDRIVAIGRALEFGPVWDGHDLLVALTRRIQVHPG